MSLDSYIVQKGFELVENTSTGQNRITVRPGEVLQVSPGEEPGTVLITTTDGDATVQNEEYLHRMISRGLIKSTKRE